jgi:hypothetical protein
MLCLIAMVSLVSLVCTELCFRCDFVSEFGFNGQLLFDNCVILTELEERRVGSNLGHMSSSLDEF